MITAKNLLTSILTLTLSGLAAANDDSTAYETPTEDFLVSSLKHGYTLSDAKRLHDKWSLQQFLNITESGAYSYLHLSEFLPHALVSRNGQVNELAYNIKESIGDITLEKEGKQVQLEKMITAKDSPVQGLLVVNNGEIAYEQYPGMRKTDRHVWMSNAKVFAGLLIAMLEDEGLIDIQKPISHYLPKSKQTDWANIKVIDVLNMQTGLDLEENPASRNGDTPYNKFVRSEVGLAARDGKVYTHDDALLEIPKIGQPGLKFEYSSANTQMLALLIEEVTQKRLSDVIAERIWMRSGMAGDAMLGLTPQGNGIIHGLISSRLDDMARFGMLFTPSAKQISQEPIVPTSIVTKMQTSGTPENYMRGTLGPRLAAEFRERPLSNSYQWDAVFEDGDLYKSGMNGQGLYVSPSRDNVVVWFSTGFSDVPMEAFSRAISLSLSPSID